MSPLATQDKVLSIRELRIHLWQPVGHHQPLGPGPVHQQSDTRTQIIAAAQPTNHQQAGISFKMPWILAYPTFQQARTGSGTPWDPYQAPWDVFIPTSGPTLTSGNPGPHREQCKEWGSLMRRANQILDPFYHTCWNLAAHEGGQQIELDLCIQMPCDPNPLTSSWQPPQKLNP